MSRDPLLESTTNGERLELVAGGAWISLHADALERLVDAIAPTSQASIVSIDMAGVEELDTLGAWLLVRLMRRCADRGQRAEFIGLPDHYRGLLDELGQVNRRAPCPGAPVNKLLAGLDAIGRAAVGFKDDLIAFLDMLGAMGAALARVLVRPHTFRLTSAVHHLNRVGWQAVPSWSVGWWRLFEV